MGNGINGLVAIILVIIIVVIVMVPIFPYEQCVNVLGYNVACTTQHVSLIDIITQKLQHR